MRQGRQPTRDERVDEGGIGELRLVRARARARARVRVRVRAWVSAWGRVDSSMSCIVP